MIFMTSAIPPKPELPNVDLYISRVRFQCKLLRERFGFVRLEDAFMVSVWVLAIAESLHEILISSLAHPTLNSKPQTKTIASEGHVCDPRSRKPARTRALLAALSTGWTEAAYIRHGSRKTRKPNTNPNQNRNPKRNPITLIGSGSGALIGSLVGTLVGIYLNRNLQRNPNQPNRNPNGASEDP